MPLTSAGRAEHAPPSLLPTNPTNMSYRLAQLANPIAVDKNSIVHSNTKFIVRKQGKWLGSGKFAAFPPGWDGRQPAWITVDGKAMSMSESRPFVNSNGQPIFTLSHPKMGATWTIDLPGQHGEPAGKIMPRWDATKDKLDVAFYNAGSGMREEVTLEVRGQDVMKKETHVFLNNSCIMTTVMVSSISAYMPGKVEWEVNIAAGMDLALATAIVVVLATNFTTSFFLNSSHKSMSK